LKRDRQRRRKRVVAGIVVGIVRCHTGNCGPRAQKRFSSFRFRRNGRTSPRLRRQHEVVTERVETALLAESALALAPALGVVHVSDPVDSEAVALVGDGLAERDRVLAVASDEGGVVTVADRPPLVLV